MVNMYRKHSILWIPDVFASLQDRAAIRAALLFVDSVGNGWWYPYQWAINQSGQRYLGGPLDFTENARADGLVVVLAVTYVAANFFRVRVQLPVVVIIFVACFYTRQSLTQSYSILSATVQPIIQQNYLNNIIPSGQQAMDLWAYHENFTTDFLLIVNECTYLILATAISVTFVMLTNLWIYHPKISLRGICSSLKFNWNHHIHPIAHISVLPRAAQNQPMWYDRSSLYDDISDMDRENTTIERSSGFVLEKSTALLLCLMIMSTKEARFTCLPVVCGFLVL
ncbi:hypothetical protein AC1031_005661 [Aphanomyces cochlioides]|nr:hypothetical protein AC1031_005661 [Aphanomyces cochlioides]